MDTALLGRKALTDALRNRAGIKSSFASQLVAGDKSPSLDTALRIEETTGIPPSFWRDHKADRPEAMWSLMMSKAA
jgi:plasmid maintenance system antidote protein VapI